MYPELERFYIVIGEAWGWNDFDKPFETLKLKLTTSNQLDKGLKMLLRSSEHLYLDIMEAVNDIFHVLDSICFQQLKHLHVQNNAAVTTIIKFNAFPSLESLCLYNLASLKSVCYGQVIAEHFPKLQSLTLLSLPKLVSLLPNGGSPILTTTMGEVCTFHFDLVSLLGMFYPH